MIWLIIIIALLMLIFGIVERYKHLRWLCQFQIRIQVNGTRGKSTIVRMLVDLFQNAGLSVAARVTGETPQHYVDGLGWNQIARRGIPRISEIIRWKKLIGTRTAQILIAENMALESENQYLFETQLFRSHLCIISNIRKDHAEVMGKTIKEIARTLYFSLPLNGMLLTSKLALDNLKNYFTKPSRIEITLVDSSTPDPFDLYLKFLEKVKQKYNLPNQALQMTTESWRRKISPQKLGLNFYYHNRKKVFIDLFSCNDIESTENLLRYLMQKQILPAKLSFILACREDRPLRTVAFLEFLLKRNDCGIILICGRYPLFTIKTKIQHSTKNLNDIIFAGVHINKFLPGVVSRSDCLVGVGNYFNFGQHISAYFKGISDGS